MRFKDLPFVKKLMPESLAAKCRLLFGLAIVIVLVIALLIPYFWMSRLTQKSITDAGSAVADTLFERHFRTAAGQVGFVRLKESGEVLDANERMVKWMPITADGRLPDDPNISDKQADAIRKLLLTHITDELAWTQRKHGAVIKNYIKLVRAKSECLKCHQEQGIAPAFNLDRPIGAIVVELSGRDINPTVLMNRVCIVAAGLLAGAGAIVAFYIIIQRIILSPVRQLRAVVNNVDEGNLDTRCKIVTADEFQRLGDALNHMLDGLQQSQEKLRQANKQLDDKIHELSERNIELFKANKLKSEFLANMSHEFRTPLNAILGFAEILRDKGVADEKNKRYAENIISSGRNLLAMITDLLELAKAESGKIELHIQKTNIQELCSSLAAFFSPLTEKKRLNVKLNIAPSIPLIKTDPNKVQQILYNLLSNAVKFTGEGGEIEVKAFMPDDNTVRISVIDTGCGIAEEDMEKIFEKFRQLDGSITRDETGTGLGLAICRELANLLAGKITVQSRPGEGSTFSLDLPVVTNAE